jgi:hypothetical protein
MRITLLTRLVGLTFTVVLIFSCGKKTEEYQSEPLSNYYPLAVGKYITYRLDSTVFINFGHNTVVRKYQVKHVIESTTTDNLGRPSYRIYRYIRDSVNAQSWTAVQPWTPNGSYFVTPLPDQIEVIEDNLRFIKLHLPVTTGFTWKGNKYLPYDPYRSFYTFSADDFMDDWDYVYGDLANEMIGQTVVNDVRTVNYDIKDASSNMINNHPLVDTSYAFNTFALDKYAKNIGLVYREYILWEHQNNPTGPNTYNPFNTGFSLKMWMIDHN